jgi:putative membrane protein
MLKDHKKDNSDFMSEAQNGQNPDVKQAAQQGDQVIQQHLQMIQQIAQAHNVTGKSKGE